ncbi:hypothetical protein CEE37_07245 [candidate division LCP-89 bacterium B3_LCP]|uniref:Glycosyl transferase family 28 C-terminal domain-containing protein n=1 Tax=candidate division LCP-89 bacterium B3_LCP TaxID=2012998 RepID=A0A532V0U3_UNCL8|nr:MAG: hypothetical protein CEE37_07245 [candidate division LCP-89 bacterium B3_LCP]
MASSGVVLLLNDVVLYDNKNAGQDQEIFGLWYSQHSIRPLNIHQSKLDYYFRLPYLKLYEKITKLFAISDMKIAIYTTAHGFGHASRSYEVAKTLVNCDNKLTVHFNSAVPDSFFAGEEHPRIFRRKVKLDVGICQVDSLTMNLPGTLDDLDQLAIQEESLISRETKYIRAENIRFILADLPHLAIEAAVRSGVPVWGMSNFSWDWIYGTYAEDYPGLDRHIKRIISSYKKADGLFTLPFSGDMESFANRIEVPLIARKSMLGKSESRRRLGLSESDRVVLFSFGGVRLKLPEQVHSSRGLVLISSEPSPDPGEPFLYVTNRKRAELKLRYPDLVAAADAVVSKPGYGIVSECIANRTALIYTSRGNFREYPVLVEEMGEYLPAEKVCVEDFKTGRWVEAFQRLLEATFPPEVDCSGAEVVAGKILGECGI